MVAMKGGTIPLGAIESLFTSFGGICPEKILYIRKFFFNIYFFSWLRTRINIYPWMSRQPVNTLQVKKLQVLQVHIKK
jgi:hypothetical protein